MFVNGNVITYEQALSDPRYFIKPYDLGGQALNAILQVTEQAAHGRTIHYSPSAGSVYEGLYALDAVQLTERNALRTNNTGPGTVAAIKKWLDGLGLMMGMTVVLPEGMKAISQEALDKAHRAHVEAGRIVDNTPILDAASTNMLAQFRIARTLLTEAGLQPDQVRRLIASPELSRNMLAMVEKLPVIQMGLGGDMDAGILSRESDRLITGLRLLCPGSPQSGPA